MRASASADDARAILKDGHCNVLVCDLRLPGTDGPVFIRQIRRDADTYIASLPAVSITASSLIQDRELALAAGYQCHLQKPVSIDELAATVGALSRTASGTVLH